VTASIPPTAKLERLLGVVETHSVTTEAAAERHDMPRAELYCNDCREAHDAVVLAASSVIAARPRTAESAEARRIADAAGDFLARALCAQIRAWSKTGNPKTREPTVSCP
jgi:hypothetical protein